VDKFKNKYRIPSARLQNWDYGSNGAYFITICTQNRQHLFGEIVEMQFIASEIGKLAHQYWLEIPIHFPFVELGNFVVMPNHTHGILIIDKNANISNESQPELPPKTTTIGGFAGNKNPMLHENVSRIIRWYKGRCSFEMRKIHADFSWQPRFHDHIIRDAQSFENIQNYIANNPLNWNKDKFYGNEK
jgi:putative transposase